MREQIEEKEEEEPHMHTLTFSLSVTYVSAGGRVALEGQIITAPFISARQNLFSVHRKIN